MKFYGKSIKQVTMEVGNLVRLIKLATSPFNPKQCYILSKTGESETVWGHNIVGGKWMDEGMNPKLIQNFSLETESYEQ